MSFFPFSSKKSESYLLLHIEQSSVSVSLVSFPEASSPEIIYTSEASFDATKESSLSENLSLLRGTLQVLLKRFVKEGLHTEVARRKKIKIHTAHIVFSSPWYFSRTKHIHIENEKTFIITENFISGILKKEHDLFQQKLVEELAEKRGEKISLMQDLRVIEGSIVHTQINGYTLETSIGKKTKIFDAYLCQSAIEKEVMDEILSLIFSETHIGKENITMHTFPIVAGSTIRDVSTFDSFLIIAVTGENTEITLVEEGVIMKSTSFSSGRNFIIEQIIKSQNVSREIAESLLHVYIGKKLEKENADPIEEIILNIGKEWLIYFEQALLELSEDLLLPTKVFLISEPDVVEVYSEFLSHESANAAEFLKDVQVISLSFDVFIKNITPKRNFYISPFLSIVILFIKKII